jgi:F-type H+/Na+-transporting ATPase subunit alpha
MATSDGVNVVRARIDAAARALRIDEALSRRGVVQSVGDGVAMVAGLEDVGYEELVEFDSGALGMAIELEPQSTGVVFLSPDARVIAGEGAVGLGRLPSIPAGSPLLGRIVDPLGAPLDGGPAIGPSPLRELFQVPPELMDRAPVHLPLHTGITVIDAAIPIGRGQRELVVGDRDVGKTSLALDIIAAQESGNMRCVYVAVGQPMSRILATRDTLLRAGCLGNTVIVAAEAGAPPGSQYLAPYAGATVAEALCEPQGDALIVYDDLTKHADAYRQLALLLGRPTGREAFPGDIFYIHAELLERAAALVNGRSITALPIVETTESDISAYIPTNLISITDGQIYLDTARFERDERPAVDVGRSVSRIGAAAQPSAVRAATRNLRVLIARFESLEALTRVGLEIEPATRKVLERGAILRELLRQSRLSPRSDGRQILELVAVSEGWLDGLRPREAAGVIQRAAQTANDALERLDSTKLPEKDWVSSLEECVREARKNPGVA